MRTSCHRGGPSRRRLRLRLCVESLSRHQPVRAQRVDRPGRVLQGDHLHDCPDARWVSLARHGIRLVSLRWRSQCPLGTTCGSASPRRRRLRLLAAHDGTLWMGTFAGLVTWSGARLTRRPDLDGQFVTSLLEDREGTVWAGTLASPAGRLCAMRSGGAQCYGEDGIFGRVVFSLYEDSSGTLWVGAESGLWRWKPGPPKRYATPPAEINDLKTADDGRLLIPCTEVGLTTARWTRISRSNPIRRRESIRINCSGTAMEVSGSEPVDRGLIHVHHGRTDTYSRDRMASQATSSSGFSRIVKAMSGSATTGGTRPVSRTPRHYYFRETRFVQRCYSVGGRSHRWERLGWRSRGLTRWKNGQTTVFRKASGLPDDMLQSLYQDDRGRIWASTDHGLAYFQDGRFVAVTGVAKRRNSFHHWGQGGQPLAFRGIRVSGTCGRGVWSSISPGQLGTPPTSFGDGYLSKADFGFDSGDGGVSYFKDRQLRASYTTANGLAEGDVAGLRLDREGALWAATEGGGVSRLKDGHIATLTSRNGLPCDTIHWTIEDDDGSFWLYAACGLVRIVRTELDAWIADPKRRVEMTVWDASDGVRLRSGVATDHGPRVVKSTDGKLWYVTGDGVQVVDPHHLAINTVPRPGAHRANQCQPQNLLAELNRRSKFESASTAHVRDLQIDYTALSLAAPEKVHFKYKLEGQDPDWKEVINDRHAQYSNLPPRDYRFRVIACNNSGTMERDRRLAGVLHRAGVLPDELDFAPSARPFFWRSCGWPTSSVSTNCGGRSTCAWRSVSRSGRVLPASYTIRCCRVFRG